MNNFAFLNPKYFKEDKINRESIPALKGTIILQLLYFFFIVKNNFSIIFSNSISFVLIWL